MAASNLEIPSLPDRSKPLFDSSSITVIFVLGGPGSGKGTQSSKIVADYGFTHLSAGDLLREEQEREGSQFGDLIRYLIPQGILVPMQITIQLLENAMSQAISQGVTKFIVDGFPRKIDQGDAFEKVVCLSSFVLFFETDDETLTTRLLNRGKTSGRSDDNIESIHKRIAIFKDVTMPVIENFKAQDKVEFVNANDSPDVVYQAVQQTLARRGIQKSS